MNNNLTDITAILDRSGSMSLIRTDIEGGFNSFVKDQQKGDGEAVLSLVQFDDKYEVVYTAKPIQDVEDLCLVPRATTALYDAIGRTIVSMGERFEKMPENERPGKVVVLILTDGYNNASHEYTAEKIKEMIQHQEEKYERDFVFMGANQDAVTTAQGIGISAANSMTYSADTQGSAVAMQSFSQNLRSYRTTGDKKSLGFMDDQRTQAVSEQK